MAARAQVVGDPTETEKALHLLMMKYPQQASLPLPMPGAMKRASIGFAPGRGVMIPRIVLSADPLNAKSSL